MTVPCWVSTWARAASAWRWAARSASARALAVIDVHAQGPDWAAIDRLHAEWKPDGIVVGDPMTLDGGDQPIRKRAHAFARELHLRYKLPVVLVDERASSIEAAQRFALDRAEGASAAATPPRWTRSPPRSSSSAGWPRRRTPPRWWRDARGSFRTYFPDA